MKALMQILHTIIQCIRDFKKKFHNNKQYLNIIYNI